MVELSNKRIAIESLIITAVTIVILRFILFVPFIEKHGSTIVAVTLIYLPFLIAKFRGHQVVIEGKGWRQGLYWFAIFSLIIFPIFFILAHFWNRIVFNTVPFHFMGPPHLMFVLGQLLVVALPEELFFRGYLQTSLNKYFPTKWTLFGVKLGWAWIITAAVFAVAHSIITFRWWHFAIFFPALIFGYLRERTGGVIAPTLFHALANVLMRWFVSCY